MTGFEYSAEFRSLVEQLHRGKERSSHYSSYIEAHLGGPSSRLAHFIATLIPEIEHHCGALRGQRVLDYGCGTGATSVALALSGASVTAFDIHAESAEIARRRVTEHRLESSIAVLSGSAEASLPRDQHFDLVLMNGVLEHIPLSISGLRQRVLRDAWSRLRPGGVLYINDTPNRLCPFDAHTTQLWWLPWLPAGSEFAYRYAVRRRRHTDVPTASSGPRGLEERGAWGATYWEIVDALSGDSVQCINLEPGHDERLFYCGARSTARRVFERFVRSTASAASRAPLTAFAPGLMNLAFRKCGSRSSERMAA